MKRLILMGGRPWLAKDGGEAFATTLFRYFPKQVKLAFCIFAQPETDWSDTSERNRRMFNQFGHSHDIEYKTMTQANFKEVSAWADAIYIPGGDPYRLLAKLFKAGDVSELWEGKVIAGSSAGADLFCKHYVYLQTKEFGKGLGWVNATCVPHWRNDFERYTDKDWDWAELEALKRFPQTPVLTIPEGDFVEFSVK